MHQNVKRDWAVRIQFSSKPVFRPLWNFCAALAAVAIAPTFGYAQSPPPMDAEGTITVPSFSLPDSSLLDRETLAVLKRERAEIKDLQTKGDACHSSASFDWPSVPKLRACQAEVFKKSEWYRNLRNQFEVFVSSQ